VLDEVLQPNKGKENRNSGGKHFLNFLCVAADPLMIAPGQTSDPGVPNRREASNLSLVYGLAGKKELSQSDSPPRNLEREKPVLLQWWALSSRSTGLRD
jgi:hypothetical protein